MASLARIQFTYTRQCNDNLPYMDQAHSVAGGAFEKKHTAVYVLYPPVAPPILNNDCTIFLLSVYISENHSITSADKYRNIAKYDIIGLF